MPQPLAFAHETSKAYTNGHELFTAIVFPVLIFNASVPDSISGRHFVLPVAGQPFCVVDWQMRGLTRHALSQRICWVVILGLPMGFTSILYATKGVEGWLKIIASFFCVHPFCRESVGLVP